MPQTREHLAILDLLADPHRLDRADQDRPDRRSRVARAGAARHHGDSAGHRAGRQADHPGVGAHRRRAGRPDRGHGRHAGRSARPPRRGPAAPAYRPRLHHQRLRRGRDRHAAAAARWKSGRRSRSSPPACARASAACNRTRRSLALAGPGRRVAVNLRGVEKSDLARGDVLGLPGAWHPTTLADAWLRYLPGAHHAAGPRRRSEGVRRGGRGDGPRPRAGPRDGAAGRGELDPAPPGTPDRGRPWRPVHSAPRLAAGNDRRGDRSSTPRRAAAGNASGRR